MGFKAIAKWAPLRVTAHFTAGEAADKQVFTADQAYELLEVIETHVAAGAASSTLMIEKTASGTAPASGTDMLASAFALDSTADTPVHKHVANAGLSATAGATRLERGNSLSCDFTGTVTAYEGVVTFILKPLPPFNNIY